MNYLNSVFTVLFLLFANSSFSQGQNDLIEDFSSGDYSVSKIIDKNYRTKIFEPIKKKWPIEVSISNGRIAEVMVKRSGIIDEVFVPDIPSHPAYFGFGDLRLTYVDNLIFYYKWTSKNTAEIKYVFSTNGSVTGKIDAHKLKLENYILSTIENQKGAKDEIKAEKKVLAEEERLKNSLQEKNPKKIEIELIDLPRALGLGTLIKYGVVATLDDGSVLKTPNLGGKLPWSDFTISTVGSTSTEEEVMVNEDGGLIPNDQVRISVSSKFHSSIKTTKEISMTYANELSFQHNGKYGDQGRTSGLACDDCGADGKPGYRGGNGANLIIDVQYVSNSNTGIDYNKIEIRNAYDGKILHKLKLSPTTLLKIECIGGNGGNGGSGSTNGYASANGGNGGDGGNGGNITINLNAIAFPYKIFNTGGYGGNGGDGEGSAGRTGSKGSSGGSGSVYENQSGTIINW